MGAGTLKICPSKYRIVNFSKHDLACFYSFLFLFNFFVSAGLTRGEQINAK
jgi:hypothetical protein